MNPIQQKLDPGLYLVATPLGSARDVTLRTLDILASADVLVAEDTRTARRLLELYGLKLAGRPMWAYHDHSGIQDRDKIIMAVKSGKSVAYMSDAGTPMIADPGYHLVQALQENDLYITSAPGPCAAINALTLAGMPTDRFTFAGFLPPASDARKAGLVDLFAMKTTIVVYETAKRLPAFFDTLITLVDADHSVAICREMTKKFEEVIKGPIHKLHGEMAHLTLKGEIVLVIDAKHDSPDQSSDIDAALRNALLTMRVKDAADSVAGAFGLPRRQIYQRALNLKSELD